MDWILRKVKDTGRTETTFPTPGSPGKTMSFKSKVCIVTNIRICKAVLYAVSKAPYRHSHPLRTVLTLTQT
jgi:hypothetical protein